MKSLYWKICGTFLVVVAVSLFAGFTAFHQAWSSGAKKRLHAGGSHSAVRGSFVRPLAGRPGLSRQWRGPRTASGASRRPGPMTMIEDSLRLAAELAAMEASRALEAGGGPAQIASLLATPPFSMEGVSAVYVDRAGVPQSVVSTSAHEALAAFRLEPDTRGDGASLALGWRAGFAFAPLPDGNGAVLLSVESDGDFTPPDAEEVHLRLARAWSSAVGVIMLVAVSLGLIVFYALTRRLGRLRSCLGALRDGDLSVRMASPGADEIGELGTAFNAMAARLEKVVHELEQVDESRRGFLADISHELRTPLTSIRANLEAMRRPEGDEQVPPPPWDRAEQVKPLRASLEEVEHLAGLVEDLLALARMDTPQFELELGEEVAQRVVSLALSRLRVSIENRNIEVVTRFPPEPIRLSCDARRLGQAVTNLLTNAIRSMNDGGRLEVTVGERGRKTVIEICDDGPGISEAELPHVFDRFRKGPRGGTGLGLAIVKGLVEAHGGTVDLSRRPEGGMRAEIVL